MKYKYQIWQVKETFVKDYAFKRFDELESDIIEHNGFMKEHYEKVYEGEYEAEFKNVVNGRIYCVLDSLFTMFNINRPADFNHRSMSVSDVVVVNGRSFYCDKFGWKEVDFEEITWDSIHADEDAEEVEKILQEEE